MNKNTAEGKGLRTLVQTLVGTVVAFVAGLWALPGVPEYVAQFAQTEGLNFLLFLAVFVGVPSGIIAWVQNKYGK